MWNPRPSATRLKPITSRKPSASTTTVGWLLTKVVSGLLATSIRITATITAAIITGRSLTMPTAVMTESSENTRSSAMICTIAMPKLEYAGLALASALPPSRCSCSSVVAL